MFLSWWQNGSKQGNHKKSYTKKALHFLYVLHVICWLPHLLWLQQKTSREPQVGVFYVSGKVHLRGKSAFLNLAKCASVCKYSLSLEIRTLACPFSFSSSRASQDRTRVALLLRGTGVQRQLPGAGVQAACGHFCLCREQSAPGSQLQGE